MKLLPVGQRIGGKVGFRPRGPAAERAKQAFLAARRFGRDFPLKKENT